MNGRIVIINIKVWADKYLLHANWTDPSFKLSVICTSNAQASLKIHNYCLELRWIPISLYSQIIKVGAIILFNSILLQFGNVIIENVLAYLALRERYVVLRIRPIYRTISFIRHNLYELLNQLKRPVIGVIVWNITVIIRDHKSKGNVLFRENFRRSVWVWYTDQRILLNWTIVTLNHIWKLIEEKTCKKH